MKKIIRPPNLPPAAGPYSAAVRAGGLVFISGQIPLTAEGVLVEGGIREQTRQVLENLTSVLIGAGLTPAHVVKTTVYLENIADFSAVNEVYGACFAQEPPARACVQVSALPKGASIEIDAVAAI